MIDLCEYPVVGLLGKIGSKLGLKNCEPMIFYPNKAAVRSSFISIHMGDGQREGDEIEMCVCTYKSLVHGEREK